ncbi:MAG: hypothetical protein KF903_05465 [Dokdonella sp.]|uniref:hypothetical protein n=1 Tax=Dokdonella sp. TaxID=2291710 RepID=UPI0025C3FD8A|nr:hypothetical protein [Dokdonella sp.]MBX3700433.1 hypothetical protein [Dokdonella sp.]
MQTQLDSLFAQIGGAPVRVHGATRQAFAKVRRGFSATVFDTLSAHLLRLAQPCIDAHRWHGLRVVAADESRLRVSTRKGAALEADRYAFGLYLPGAELTLHAALHGADGCERQMLFEALDATEADDLLVLDRGLIGNTVVASLRQRGRHFCMRVDASGYACVRAFLRSGKSEALGAAGAAAPGRSPVP